MSSPVAWELYASEDFSNANSTLLNVSVSHRTIKGDLETWDQSLEETVVQIPEGAVQEDNDRQ